MHMADGLVSPAVGATMFAASTVAAAYAVRKVRAEDDPKKIPLMGVMGAFVFAAQMINFTIPGTGSSGHIGGAMLLAAVLGPYAAFLSMIAILTVQCLLFADGGLLALGANIWNMAFYGSFVAGIFIWKSIVNRKPSRLKIYIASIVGSVLALQLGAFSVVLQTLASGVTELPFRYFILAMQPIHLAIGIVEGVITASVLHFLYEARPELIWIEVPHPKKGGLSRKWTIAVLAVVTVGVGALLSLFASSLPDGLEWSIARTSGAEEVARNGFIYTLVEQIQSLTALLPDYSLKSTDHPGATSLSGLLGASVVLGLTALAALALRFFTRHKGTDKV